MSLTEHLRSAFLGKEAWSDFAIKALNFKSIPKAQAGWIQVPTSPYSTDSEMAARALGFIPSNPSQPSTSNRLVMVEVDGDGHEKFTEREIGQRLRRLLRSLGDPDTDPALAGSMHLAWLPLRDKGRLVAVEFATLRRSLSGKLSEDILFRHRLELLDDGFSRTPLARLEGFAKAMLAHQDQRVYASGNDLDPSFLELRKALTSKNACLALGTAEFLRAALSALFDVQALNDAFFQELNQRFREDLLLPLLKQGKSASLPPEETRSMALNLLMRLLFLRFLEGKGWILGDEHWLLKQDLASVKDAYTEVLEPVFRALALPSEQRPPHLPKVPYLNGGLFDVDDLSLKGLQLAPQHLNTFRAFLYQHAFTLEESSPLDQRVAIDPEMLGRVFETLVLAMEEAESSGTDLEEALEKGVGKGKTRRKITGSYYTPRVIVQYLCRETLDAYLAQATGEAPEIFSQLRALASDSTAERPKGFGRTRAKAVKEALHEVRVCDPAVGSGAFLLGMMQEILLLLQGLEAALGSWVDLGGLRAAEWKRNIITRNLYGVDLNPEAVEICRLRLWLSLIIDAGDGEPLPSLDFRILCGDSLVDRLGEETFPDSIGGEQKRAWAARTDRVEEAHREAETTKALKARFAEETDPLQKRALRDQIQAHSRAAHKAELLSVREDLAHRIRSVESNLRWKSTRKEEKALALLKAQETWIQKCLAQLQKDGYLKKPFLWKLAFPEVLEKGGFDVIVGNPPYVRQENLDATDQGTYAHAFSSVFAGTADLYAFFFQRSHQLLKSGGQLGFITSNGFTKRDWGGNLSKFLATQFEIRHAIDFGELKVFEATVEPYIVVAAKRTPASGHALEGHFIFCEVVNRIPHRRSKFGSLAEVRQVLEEQMGDILAKDCVRLPQQRLLQSGWRLEDGAVLDLYDKLLTLPNTQPLGTFAAGRMYYGIKTGLNEAFVIDDAKRRELIRQDPKSAELIKPWLRGKDVKRWQAEGAGLHLLAVQNSGDADCTQPWKHIPERQEQTAEDLFKQTYPAVWAHLKAWEAKLRPRADQGKFWWELRACAYYSEFTQSKVIWPDIARTMRFSWDTQGSFLGNTAYFGVLPKWSVGLLNSELVVFLLCQLTNSIRGGFIRLFTENVQHLPIRTPEKADQQRLEALVDALSGKEPEDRLALEAQLNDLVYEIYGLSATERDLIANWFERRSLTGAVEEDDEEALTEAE